MVASIPGSSSRTVGQVIIGGGRLGLLGSIVDGGPEAKIDGELVCSAGCMAAAAAAHNGAASAGGACCCGGGPVV